MVEIGVDKNSTIMFPAPLMSTIEEIGAFLSREAAAAVPGPPATASAPTPVVDVSEPTGDTPNGDTPNGDTALVPSSTAVTDGHAWSTRA
jgi:hypothetical protein